MLLSVHGLWLREHNRVARKLAYINPKWDDETLYQEARRITIAQYQHIIVHEFVPVLIGEKLSRDFELLPLKDGYATDYEKKVQANTINEFAAAAIRIAHTLVVDEHKRADKYHRLYDLRNISDYQFNTVKYAIDAPLEDILYGSLNEATYIKACQMNKEMNNFLFEGIFSNENTKRWALFTRNMARGRDHGFPGYNYYREKCGLNRARHFEDLRSNIPDFLIERLKKLYGHVDDIDLYAGLISEEPLKGAAAGFTS
ncbi:Chorion peroxidase, partial [Brachionus plicatilis]